MANFEGLIDDFVAGNDITIERTVTGVPAGQTLTMAWFTVKSKFSDLDADAKIQKEITTVLDANQGHISDSGADETGTVIFYLQAADTLLLYPLSEYRYDIQVKTSGGKIYTPELGIIMSLPRVTQSTT